MEKVLYISDYYDRPISGIATANGRQYYFVCPFCEALDDYSDTYLLYEIDVPAKSLRDADYSALVDDIEEMIVERRPPHLKAKPSFERTTPGANRPHFVAWAWIPDDRQGG